MNRHVLPILLVVNATLFAALVWFFILIPAIPIDQQDTGAIYPVFGDTVETIHGELTGDAIRIGQVDIKATIEWTPLCKVQLFIHTIRPIHVTTANLDNRTQIAWMEYEKDINSYLNNYTWNARQTAEKVRHKRCIGAAKIVDAFESQRIELGEPPTFMEGTHLP